MMDYSIIVIGVISIVSISGICMLVKGKFVGKVFLKFNLGKIFNFEVKVDKPRK